MEHRLLIYTTIFARVVLLWNKFELQTGEENNNGKESQADKNREQPETAFAVDNNESTESDEKMDLC